MASVPPDKWATIVGADLKRLLETPCDYAPMFQLITEPAPHVVHYWGTKAHYVPPTEYLWRSWEPGPTDCEWIVPGTAEGRACRTYRLI